MSAVGPKQTWVTAPHMSAFGGDIAPREIGYPDKNARAKKPKVQIKREKTSLGLAFCIYIDGTYGFEAASAREGAKRMLEGEERKRIGRTRLR